MRESIEVRIVELEVTVLDRAGKPVADLTRDDFAVRAGKRDVPISNFFAVRGGVIVTEDGSSPAPAAKSAPAPETTIPTSLIIFVDELHLSQRSRMRAIAAVRRYVSENVGANTTAMLVRYKGNTDVRVRPTEKPGYILAELEKIEREPSQDNSVLERDRMIQEIEYALFAEGKAATGVLHEQAFHQLEQYARRRGAEVDRSLAALKQTLDVTSAFHGRKVLLYVSDGLPQSPGIEMFDYWDRAIQRASSGPGDWKVLVTRKNSSQAMQYDRTEEFRKLTQAAQKADVALFSFDAGGARGLEGRGPETRAGRAQLNSLLFQSNLRSGLQYAAEETGGMYVSNDSDIDNVLARMSAQFSTYYSIGVSPQRGDIRVAVKNRPDLRVLTARRIPPRTRAEELELDVRRRLYTRVSENPLNATMALGTATRIDGNCMIPLRVAVPQPKLAPGLTPDKVDVHMVMLNENNDESAVQQIDVPFRSGRATHSMMLRVRPQKHVLSLAILNPASGESSFLQGEVDGTTCH